MKKKLVSTTKFSLLLAILAIFCFTTLGQIPIGPLVATLAMIPVIITGISMGVAAGSAMGLMAGIFSLIVWSTNLLASPVAFVFTPLKEGGNFGSLLICLVPRILVGTSAALSYQLLHKMMPKKQGLAIAISASIGSLINTILVMGGIWLFFGEQYATVAGKTMLAIVGATVITNGIPEIVASIVIAVPVCMALFRLQRSYE